VKALFIFLLIISSGALAQSEIYKFDAGIGLYHCINTTDPDECNRPLAFEELNINMQKKDETTKTGSWQGSFPYQGITFSVRVDIVETLFKGAAYTNIISRSWNTMDTKQAVNSYETKNIHAWHGKIEQVGKYMQKDENYYLPILVITSKGYGLREYLNKNHTIWSAKN